MEDRQIFTHDIRRTLVVLAIMAALVVGMVLLSRHGNAQVIDSRSGSGAATPPALFAAARQPLAPIALAPGGQISFYSLRYGASL